MTALTIVAPTEWNCRRPRCVADEAKYTGPDPREQDEAARHAAGGTTEASEGDDA